MQTALEALLLEMRALPEPVRFDNVTRGVLRSTALRAAA
jgi:hypothetical protein